jgi:di/tripeptidase
MADMIRGFDWSTTPLGPLDEWSPVLRTSLAMDGSRLSARGLPTPNVFTGGEDFHSRHEWICVADMGAAVATIVQLAQIWAE